MNDTTTEAGIACRIEFITGKFFRQNARGKEALIRKAIQKVHALYSDQPISVTFNEDVSPAVLYVPKLTIFSALTAYAKGMGMEDVWAHNVFMLCSPSIYIKAMNHSWIPAYPDGSLRTEQEINDYAEEAYAQYVITLVNGDKLTIVEACVAGNVELSTAYNIGIDKYNAEFGANNQHMVVYDAEAITAATGSTTVTTPEMLEVVYQQQNTNDPNA